MSQKPNLIAETSTGSIIAGALTAGMSPEEILSFHSSMSAEIFKKVDSSLDEFLNLKAKYSSSSLFQALSEAFLLKGFGPKSYSHS